MGRFLNARAVAAVPPVMHRVGLRPPDNNVAVEPEPAELPELATEVTKAPESMAAPYASSPIVTLGLYALCVYLVSGYATDLSYRFLGTKPYLSMISGVVVFVCFLLSGNMLAALRTTVGKLWLGLAVWMCLAVVFSRWRGGSLDLLETYLPKQHFLVFYAAAFAIAIRNCRTLFRACALGGFVLLACCFFFGQMHESGRFDIPTNIFLSNPNDLAMQLLLCMGFFMFLIRQPNWGGRVAGVFGLLGAVYYLMLTGSRGGMLAAGVFAALCLVFNERRLQVTVIATPIAALLIGLVPVGVFHRLSLTLVDPNETVVSTVEEEKTISSQMARERLLKIGVDYALTNPIFGIGPGRFEDAITEDGKKQGRHEASVGPHNTYTQIAAECGIPALMMFAAALFVTIRGSFRLYRATSKDRSMAGVSAMAFACFVVTSAFSLDLFFHHMAYSMNVPTIFALWISTDLAARRALASAYRERAAATSA